MKELIEPYKLSGEAVLKALGVSPESGLSDDEVRKRSGVYSILSDYLT